MVDLTVVILTKNEELHLERAIASVKPFANEVIVVDSYSTDRTCDLARSLGAAVFQNRFINQAKQFQWALDNCDIKTSWIMRLDADEVIEPDLVRRIQNELESLPAEVVGVNLLRKHIFLGRWIRFGGRYPVTLLRIWRVGHGRVEDRWMDEHVFVWGGRTVTFKGGFADWNLKDVTYFTDKHNQYATREAVQVLAEKYALFDSESGVSLKGASAQAAIKRFVKVKLFNRLPFTVSSFMYFVWRYVFQLGFLDGREGVVYHFLQGYWYRFLVGTKVLEFEKLLMQVEGRELRVQKLEEASGLPLRS